MIRVLIVLDKRYKKSNSTYPVKLRLTFARKQKYYETPFCFSEKEFKKIMFGERLNQKEKNIKNFLNEFDNRASEIVLKMTFFSVEEFEKKFFYKKTNNEFLKNTYQEKISRLESNGQINTASSYRSALNSLENHLPKIKISNITPSVLGEYEKKLKIENKSINTISIYMRTLRSIFNEAIHEGLISNETYPFKRKEYETNKYDIPVGSNIKKALKIDEIKKIVDFKTVLNSKEDKAKDFWLFSYFCNGMNIKDICLLKFRSIDFKSDMLYYKRAKTIKQKKELIIKVALNDITKNTIKKWGNKNKAPDNYVFQILDGSETSKELNYKVQNFVKSINKQMKKIGLELGFNLPLTTYVSRHSFATIMYKIHKDVKLIRETLGHTSNRTSEIYLDSFDDGEIKEKTKALLDF